nr:alpha/beta hydrolase [Saccharopolyspora gloriosae]
MLLAGGVESAHGYFPGLVEGLTADPGCRVILHDRPGAGEGETVGTLQETAHALHATLRESAAGPVVVVGHSLGGALAALLARDHPEDVAGLVLLDPTPINAPGITVRLERVCRTMAVVLRVPGARRIASAFVGRYMEAEVRRLGLRPDCEAAFRQISRGALDFAGLAAALVGVGALSANFREADLPRVPAAVVSAERKPASEARRAHQRLASALGTSPIIWPGATHAVHLDHPDDTLATIRDVVTRATPSAERDRT